MKKKECMYAKRASFFEQHNNFTEAAKFWKLAIVNNDDSTYNDIAWWDIRYRFCLKRVPRSMMNSEGEVNVSLSSQNNIYERLNG
ncbi:hypothetical protein L9W80_18460 [Vibrio aestuarianus]|uniref:hypothetical protein n=1 Tax=Vibrio aestuarianus TaxID=28171 RepID=UPI00237D2A40|nr:hypothetical protein [Vibrio aestuarianus]MDE1352122.1 hypothetical protein [Vibrio aestuarianus]